MKMLGLPQLIRIDYNLARLVQTPMPLNGFHVIAEVVPFKGPPSCSLFQPFLKNLSLEQLIYSLRSLNIK